MLGKGLRLKLLSCWLFSVVSKLFRKLGNNRIVDHLEKCGFFPDFQYGFRSSGSTADLLAVASDRFARVFNRSGATGTVTYIVKKGEHKKIINILTTSFK